MESEQIKAKKYSSIKNRIFSLGLLIDIMLLVLLQFSGISTSLKMIAMLVSDNFYIVNALYATFLGVIFYIVKFPLGFYRSYALEHIFGLSNQALGAWAKDELKKTAISYMIFLVFVEVLYISLRRFPHNWWILVAGLWILFGIIFAELVPVLIIPLFYKYTELKNERLKQRLIRLAQACEVKILNVFKLDLSAKTKIAFAAFAGIGNTKRILLSDTLFESYTDDEIEVILAHELAHYKFKHIWRILIFSALFTITNFYLIGISLSALIDFLGIRNIYDIAAFPAILLFFIIFGIISMPVQNWYSRRLERKADVFAIKLTKLPEVFISCMDKLARQNLANVSPSRFIEIMLYDHPPISKRIHIAQEIEL